ncbi:MAG: hypothetical protein WCB67_00375 [Solirubrobacteraceae bacterium]
MPLKRRLILPLAGAAVLGALGVLLLAQSHARASSPMNYSHLNKIQKRIISQTLASALAPAPSNAAPINDQGGGPDGAPFATPQSYGQPNGSSGGADNYFPSASGECPSRLGDNIKVNQNCLNISDPDLQGRSQANNETSIAQDPFSPNHLVASDNNYIRGDGTCGAHY